ncbi:MAG TPA: deoxyribonuclease IV [Gemmatimonadales bacterium]|nr:deoxyribonuclease IV [Gemmatimonadales bacterium]
MAATKKVTAAELLGAHVSTAGGPQTAPPRGVEIGATAIQLFTKTPNQWREPVLSEATVAAYRTAWAESGLGVAVSHDSYLINLASPDAALRKRSIASFTAELTRCTQLGVPYVVSHPGNFMDDRDAGLTRNAQAYAECLEAVPGPVMVLMETTAGTGTALGSTFEELAELRARMPKAVQARVGYCADTCHLYAAGYDLVNDYDGVWERFDRVCGLERLRCLHLNDSKTPFASHRDRHELIAEGSLGAGPFKRIMNDPRMAGVAKILETPKSEDMVTNDRKMLARLRGYVGKR